MTTKVTQVMQHFDPAAVLGAGYSHAVSVFVPSTMDVSTSLATSDADAAVTDTLVALSRLFGGATAIPASGGWVTGDGLLVTESVTIVWAAAGELTNELLWEVREYALQLKARLNQEAIALSVDGVMYFV